MTTLAAVEIPAALSPAPNTGGWRTSAQTVKSSLTMRTPVGRAIGLLVIATIVLLVSGALELRSRIASIEAGQLGTFESAHAFARMAAAEIEEAIWEARATAAAVERLPDFWEGADEDRDEILAALNAERPYVNASLFFSRDFQTRGSSNHVAGQPRPSVAERSYAQEIVTTGQLAVSDQPLRALTNGNVVLPIAVPIRERGPSSRSGFLMSSLRVEALPAFWTNLPLPPGSVVNLVDTRANRVLASSATNVGASHIAVHLAAGRGEGSDQVIDATLPSRDVNHLRTDAAVTGTPWVAVVDIPLGPIVEPFYAEARTEGLVALTLTAAILGALYQIWRWMSTRLLTLRCAATHWSAGDWSYRTGLTEPDDLGQLGQAFDQMADRLSQAVQQNESILISAGEGIVGVDRAGRITFVNPAAAELLGQPADGLIGTTASEHLLISELGSSGEERQILVSSTLSSGQPRRISEGRLTTVRGPEIAVSGMVTPIMENAHVTGAVLTLNDVSPRQAAQAREQELLAELSARERQLQDLVHRMLLAHEEGQRRAAYEVHDGLAQIATAAQQHLETYVAITERHAGVAHPELSLALELSRSTVQQARRLIAGLRPIALDDFGLHVAIRLEVEALERDGWEIPLRSDLGEARLPAGIEVALFRVTQEALQNVRKHSGSARAEVVLSRTARGITINVHDWGRGFDPASLPPAHGRPGHIGLDSMRERMTLLGGTFDIESAPGVGTRVRVWVPNPTEFEAESVPCPLQTLSLLTS
ncbi:MAG: ATP-binding protein [Chloroflexota bacterium]